MVPVDAHDAGFFWERKPKQVSADAHDAGFFGAKSPSQVPDDAHDAGPVGTQSSKRYKLLLVKLGLLGRKAPNGTS